ncbi:MAGUK p55 subfamily member 5 [Sarcoptes scabiei]|nr:MAGUK p55 subfamily member 5 [Sarcoptes scabiei]
MQESSENSDLNKSEEIEPELPTTIPQPLSLKISSKFSNDSRLPYYYPPSTDNIGQYEYGTFDPDEMSEIENKLNCSMRQDQSSIYQRYRYYNRLFNSSENFRSKSCPEAILRIPNHVIPWYFILPKVSVPAFEIEEKGKQSSIVTIFAIWNMMMGTSLLCLPWAYHQAGLIGGCLLTLLMTAICFFTASLVIRVPQIISVEIEEFTDLCSMLLGNVAHKISQISSMSILAGGAIVYWVLMSNFLRHIISFVYQVEFLNMTIGLNSSSVVCNTITNVSELTDTRYNHFMNELDWIVPVALVVVIGPITCLPSVSFFLRFNIIGTLSVFYLLAFSTFKAYNWSFFHLSLDPKSIYYVPLFDWNFPAYTGVLSLAMFIHNCLTTLMKTQKNPQHNQRDLAIAYVLVSSTYLFISTVIYISFPLDKNCIKDNFLDNFESNDLFAFITRLFLLLQVFSLFPLLVYMVRIQVLQLFRDPITGEISYRLIRIILLNMFLLLAGCLFAAFYPQIGTIIRYCGSFSGMILIFVLPIMTFIKARILNERPLGKPALAFLFFLIGLGIANFIAQFFVHN